MSNRNKVLNEEDFAMLIWINYLFVLELVHSSLKKIDIENYSND
jgi:hypothetical protein